MQGLFKNNRMTLVSDAISDCANKLKTLQKMKFSYPPQEEQSFALSINLKA